jgi:hypothetical protein
MQWPSRVKICNNTSTQYSNANTVWEPPTKQFYAKCQSPRVLLSCQSTRSIAAPSCIRSRPASRHSIIDGQTQLHSQWSSNTSQRNGQVTTGLHQEATALAGSLRESSRRVTATRTNRSAHRPVETASLFILSRAATGPSRSTRTFSVCAWYHISLALHSVQSSVGPFEINANIQCVCVYSQQHYWSVYNKIVVLMDILRKLYIIYNRILTIKIILLWTLKKQGKKVGLN